MLISQVSDVGHSNDGAVAVEPTSKGVKGGLAITINQYGPEENTDTAAARLFDRLSVVGGTGISDAARRDVTAGRAVSRSGTFPTGHVVHLAEVITATNINYAVTFLTTIAQAESRPVFDAIIDALAPL
jgi:hypothetical protein